MSIELLELTDDNHATLESAREFLPIVLKVRHAGHRLSDTTADFRLIQQVLDDSADTTEELASNGRTGFLR